MALKHSGSAYKAPRLVERHITGFSTEELKVGPFKPEYAGKLNFYISAADDLLRTVSDAPTVGLLLCESRGKSIVEYALRDVAKPIGISTYRATGRLPKALRDQVPSIEDLQGVIGKLRTELQDFAVRQRRRLPDPGAKRRSAK